MWLKFSINILTLLHISQLSHFCPSVVPLMFVFVVFQAFIIETSKLTASSSFSWRSNSLEDKVEAGVEAMFTVQQCSGHAMCWYDPAR